MDFTSLFISFVVGLLGTAMFMFGKKSGRLVPMGSGVGLMIVPSLLPGIAAVLIVSGLLAALPFFVRD